MHALSALALALAGSALAAPAIKERSTEQENFSLSVTGSADLNGWAIVEAHVGAGINAIEIQRPSAYQSEKVHLFGTSSQVNNGAALLFSSKAAGSKFMWGLPTPPSGGIAQVFSQLGVGTNSFGTNAQLTRLTADGSAIGFLACPKPVNGEKVYTLWYGGQGAVELPPHSKCQGIQLQVNL